MQVVWMADDAGKARQMVWPGLHSKLGYARCPSHRVNNGPDHCNTHGLTSDRPCTGMMYLAM